MKLEVIREACCAQDDQSGSLTLSLDISSGSQIWELAKAIGEANFLQFSTPNTDIYIYCANNLLFSIPVVGAFGSKVKYHVPQDDKLDTHVVQSKIECIWPHNL